ncbi:hypothetical protein GH733_008454 [Mirounga leonina]|nr:hypothetical protein GH733_008454 [Mirounga leonina]
MVRLQAEANYFVRITQVTPSPSDVATTSVATASSSPGLSTGHVPLPCLPPPMLRGAPKQHSAGKDNGNCQASPQHEEQEEGAGRDMLMKRLSSYVEPLKKQVADVQKLVIAQERKPLELRDRNLPEKVTEKGVMSEVKLLVEVKSICNRKEGCGLPPWYSALQKVIRELKEVPLDPKTAHPNQLIPEDKKQQ